MSAPATATVEVHHEIPRCLLRLRERAEAAGLAGEGIELALERATPSALALALPTPSLFV